ncbi:MAG: SIS domain-containing protein [Spirochaetia bacterium]|nr:SIS domain-containing protein [Spirochaetia bacterium]
MKDKINSYIYESIKAKESLLNLTSDIEKAGLLAAETVRSGKKILLCGNGGSAADAQHIAAELIVRFVSKNERKALPAISLTLDPSSITACGNDYGYEFIFSRALEALGNEGDLLIGISTSGKSQNVIRAIEKAREKNIKVLLLLGSGGGRMKGMGDIEILVENNTPARIQECHILIGHILCSIIEKKLFDFN